MREALLAVVMLATLVVVVSCSSPPTSDPTSAESPRAVVEQAAPEEASTPTPTSVVLTKEEAGQAYLDIVAKWNADRSAWDEAEAAKDVETLRTLATANAAVLRGMTDALLATSWPEDVKPTITKLVAEWSSETTTWASAGASTSEDELYAYLNQLSTTSSSQELRVLLGLENVPVG